jgi:hypothetical protein
MRPRCAQHSAAAVLISILLLSCVGGTASADEPQLLAVQPISGPPGTAVTVTGRGWSPRYYASGVRIGFAQNFGNGVLKKYADDIVVKPNANGTLSFRSTIPRSFKAGDVVTFSGLIGNGSGANANFTVTGAGGSTATADLQPTAIMFNRTGIAVGKSVHFDSGVRNTGSAGTGVFNIKWLVDGHEVGAHGSHAGVPARSVVLTGNSQFDGKFDSAGRHEVTFIVDADNHVAESNEGNNKIVIAVDVPGAVAPVISREQLLQLWKNFYKSGPLDPAWMRDLLSRLPRATQQDVNALRQQLCALPRNQLDPRLRTALCGR